MAELHPDIMHICKILVQSLFYLQNVPSYSHQSCMCACFNLHLSSLTEAKKDKTFLKKKNQPPLQFSNCADSNGNVRWRTFPPAGGLFNLEFSEAASAYNEIQISHISWKLTKLNFFFNGGLDGSKIKEPACAPTQKMTLN